ncbi:MAG TPA: hypothetical protein DDW65_12970 [Firmicutes bacterium]|jgi:hypothetical protein|nr:hypothetical protein [Bacillota bacterium]
MEVLEQPLMKTELIFLNCLLRRNYAFFQVFPKFPIDDCFSVDKTMSKPDSNFRNSIAKCNRVFPKSSEVKLY